MSNALDVTERTFETEVVASDVPVLVDFWASWCMPCRMLAPVVDQIAAEYEGKARVVKVNVDDNPALSARFGIRGIPTLLVMKNGEIADRLVGVQAKNTIAAKLNDVLGA